MQDIKISQILDDLERGVTRTSDSPGYKSELGSIKDNYNLTEKELKYLFKHPKLKNKKPKLPVLIQIIDDTEEEVVEKNDTAETPVEYVNNSGLTEDVFVDPWQKEVEEVTRNLTQSL